MVGLVRVEIKDGVNIKGSGEVREGWEYYFWVECIKCVYKLDGWIRGRDGIFLCRWKLRLEYRK